MKKLFYILILILISLIPILAETPSVSQRIYWPGMWDEGGSLGRFRTEPWVQDTFLVRWTVTGSNPDVGYPYRPGCVVGINDTAKVGVYFNNRSDDDFSLASQSPETWFYPELYDPYVDVFTSSPIADSSEFGHRFEHWIDMFDSKIISKPDTIHCSYSLGMGHGTDSGMILSVWGVPAGTYRVILKPTVNLPNGVIMMMRSSSNTFQFTHGENLIDTLNSYSNIAANAYSRNEFTLFNTYVDSIFYYNSGSLPGWALRYHGYFALGDSANSVAALDSVLSIIDNRSDPLIPDTSHITQIHESWLAQWRVDYNYYRECLTDTSTSGIVKIPL